MTEDNINRFSRMPLKQMNIMPENMAFDTKDVNDQIAYDVLSQIQNAYDNVIVTERARYVSEQNRLDCVASIDMHTQHLDFLEAKIDSLRILLGEVLRKVKDVDDIRSSVLSACNNNEDTKVIIDIAILHSCS